MNFSAKYFADAQKLIMGVLESARPELLAHHGKIGFETKADDSIVTELDKQLELKLREALRGYDAGVGLWGEEHGREGNEKSFWMIDPIDGTESYVRGLPGCRNILTFMDNDEAQFALAYRFTSGDLFTAQKNQQTMKNGRPVSLSSRPLKRAWLEFAVNMRRPEGYKIYQQLRPKIGGITVHLDFLKILEGSVEGLVVYKSGGSEWDYAPRELLISCAGGRVTNIGSDKYDYRDKNLVAATPLIYDDVKAAVESANVPKN